MMRKGNPLNVFVSGANGRMGKQIICLAVEDPGLFLAGATEHPDCPVLGADAGLNAGTKQISVSITGDLKRSLEKRKGVIIDFSSVESTLENIKRAVDYSVPMVIGTTGFQQEQLDWIRAASQKIPMVFTPNMSVGMNVTFKLVEQAAKVLKDDFDMEIFEIHHRNKVDAPSGTAMKLARLVCQNTDRKFPEALKFHREGKIGARTKEEVGMQVIRGGDVVGEHLVYFCGSGERIEIKHVATSRATFAAGAIRSAKWVSSQKPGLYDMCHVLGMK